MLSGSVICPTVAALPELIQDDAVSQSEPDTRISCDAPVARMAFTAPCAATAHAAGVCALGSFIRPKMTFGEFSKAVAIWLQKLANAESGV